MPIFTVFTGTYNSEKVIHRLFNSVKHQTCQDFEWLIIDDCSSDDTVTLIENFCEQHPSIDTKLIKHTTNTGVATSRKEALFLARGTYFVTWDHDDEQDNNQLALFLNLWKNHGVEKTGNIFAKMTDQSGNLLGEKFPTEPYISDYIQMHNRYLIGNRGSGKVVEHHVCVKTEKFLEVIDYYESNPHLLGGFPPNGGDVWGMMAYLDYQTIYTNHPVRKYYVDEPGRKSMSSAKRKDGAERIFRNKLLWVNYFDKRQPMSEIKFKLRNIFALLMYGYMAGFSLAEIKKMTIGDLAKSLLPLFYFPAMTLGKKFLKQ